MSHPLQGLLERTASVGAWTLHLPEQALTWTPRLAELFGMPGAAPPPFDQLFMLYAPEARDTMQLLLQDCLVYGDAFDEEVQVASANGQRIWVRAVGEAVRNDRGDVTGLHGVVQDLTERKQAEAASVRLNMRLSTTLASITEAFVTLDTDGRFTYLNAESERLLGRVSTDLLGKTLWHTLSGIAGGRLRRELRLALSNGHPVEFEEFYASVGKWLELRAYPFEEGLAVYFRDITERRVAKEDIERLAFYDALTQLPNRQLLMERLESTLSQSAVPPRVGALMFIDLDHFKVINDTQGHAKGDLLLQKVACRLSACVRHTDTVARLGGDEFVVMLDDQGDDITVATARTRVVGEKILVALSEPYDLAGTDHHATCSIGITTFARQGENIGDLLKQADLAMYEAKAAGRNSVCFFDPRMQAAATAGAALNLELRQGLRDHAFDLYYQPQVGHDGHMFGVEALLRWRHPGRGLVFPDEFIPQAEDSGLILPLGKWVLETACAQLALWAQRPETAKLSVAVNVSVRQFRHPEFVELVMAAIKNAGINAHRLKLELTESLLATNIEVTIAKMGVLKEAGLTLAIDDFGMGYSALSYLKYLPLDQLKIDRTFVKDILTDPNDAAIARTIIGLAQSLGLAVMAEGVETVEQRDLLARYGCTCYQGFLFSRALPIDELEIFMQGLPVST